MRVQLQTGNRDVVPSLVMHGDVITYLQVAMMVRTLAETTVGWNVFTRKRDGEACIDAAFKLVRALERAMDGNHFAGDGNVYRETFKATEKGRPAQYRLDVEVRGGRLWAGTGPLHQGR